MTETILAPAPMLAEATAPVFLMSVAKPLVSLALFVPYASLVSGTLAKDASYYNLKPVRWSAIFLAFAAAAFLAVVLIPFWAAGVSTQAILLAAPCVWYVKFRNRNAKGAKQLNVLNFDFAAMAAERRSKSARGSVDVRFMRKDRTEYPVPDQKSPEYAVYLALQDLVLPVLGNRTQRMDIALSKQGAAISQMTDGIRAKRDPIAGEQATAVIDLLKSLAGLDPRERRKYQRGSVPVLRGDARTTLTVSAMGSMQGESIRVDVERERQLTVPLAQAGMLEAQLKLLNETREARQGGTFLLGARPGQGLTTLGYSMLGSHDAYVNNIKTLERRPERQVDGVEHAEFDAGKAEYSSQLQTIVRRGPDVVLLTEAGEPGVGKVVCTPNARSTTFYVLMPSDNVPELLTAWLKAVGDPSSASEMLSLVVACRLVRKLCPACRVSYQPTPDIAKLLAIPAGKAAQLYRPSGKVLVKDQPTDCPACGGTGYLGLTGAFEVLAFDDESRKLLGSGDVKGAYLQARRACRSLALQEAALMKVRAGETSLEEVKRVFAPPAQAASPHTRPAAPTAPAAKGPSAS